MCNKADYLFFRCIYTHVVRTSPHTQQRQLSGVLLIADLLTTIFTTIPYCTGRMHHSVVWLSRPQGSAAHKYVWIASNFIGTDITKVQHVFVTQCWTVACLSSWSFAQLASWIPSGRHFQSIVSQSQDPRDHILPTLKWKQMNTCLVLVEITVISF